MKSTLIAAAISALASTAFAQDATPVTVPDACPVEAPALDVNDGLTRSRAAVANGRLTILAMGSSSIEGIGASRPELSFVPLLQAGLQRRLPGVEVRVINKGIGGETAKETADRLKRETEANRPDLVIWQIGTNDVLRDRPLDDVFADLRRGEAILDAADVDVMLIDPQRLPEETRNAGFRGRNPALSAIGGYLRLEGGRKHYAVQRRHEFMAGWGGLMRGGVGPDDLHLNDAGYACWAETTARSLAEALR